MGQLSPLAPRIYQIQHCIRQFPFAPRAVSHSLVQWGNLFPLFICQVAGIRLSSFFFPVSILPLSFAFVNTASYFQIYKNLEEGKKYTRKSMPVVVKNYKETRPKSVIIFVEQYFGIFLFLEFLQLYAECTLDIRLLLDPILAKV